MKSRLLTLAMSLFFLALTMSMIGTSTTATAAPYQVPEDVRPLGWPRASGFVDELFYRVIRGNEQQVLALRAGEIDLVGEFIDAALVPTLYGVPDIELNFTDRAGFGRISFNCIDPKNVTSRQEFRQAFAYALDKNGIQIRAHGGYARSADSIVPPVQGPWSLDNHPELFTENYYEPDPVKGNALLDLHGWVDYDGDGWRDHPDTHAPVDVRIVYSQTTTGDIVTQMSAEALETLNIKSHIDVVDFNTYLADLENADYQMLFWGISGSSFLTMPTYMLDFVTDAPDNDKFWSNATYDQYVANMLATQDIDEAMEWSLKAQQILWIEQPELVAYQNIYISAYRTDKWTGFVNTNGRGVFSPWTFAQVRLKAGADEYGRGGRFIVGLPEPMENTNPLNTNSAYSWMTMNMVYDGLYSLNPYDPSIQGSWLAKDWKIEEVNASSGDPNYQAGDAVKITFDLYDNIYWHDHTATTPMKLTSADIQYTYELMQESGAPSWASTVQNVTHVETPTDLQAVVYSDLTGLFTFQLVAGISILPKHIWQPVVQHLGDGSDDWDYSLTWENPTPVGCGPYKWGQRVPGELVVLKRYDDYIYNPARLGYVPPEPTVTTGPTTTTTTTTTKPSPGFELFVGLVGIAALALVEKRRKK
ncbi:MAG: ABC transporter substrate-binding protein [Candidatus Odinarchaeota archaeon]